MKSRRYTQLVIQLVLLYLFTFFSCPETSIISPFVYDKENGRAEAKLYSMFKFPDSNRVHFQCDILVCKGRWWYNNNEKIFKFHEKNDQIVFSVNIKKKGSIHSFFFVKCAKKKDRPQSGSFSMVREIFHSPGATGDSPARSSVHRRVPHLKSCPHLKEFV